MTDKNPLAHYSGVLSEAVQESAAAGRCLHQIQEPAPSMSMYASKADYEAATQAAPAAVAVPEGWKLVPEVPTDEMIRAMRRQRSGARAGKGDRDLWRAALAATPAAAPDMVSVKKVEHAPVLYVSKGQLENFRDPDGPDSTAHGRYLPARVTPAGKFTTPLFAASQAQSADFQQRVQPWMMACFGPEISADRIERNHRFLEESLELVQSLGCTASEAHQLMDYVFGRPVGEPVQEAGGVMVTLAALCLASGLDMHACGETELARIWTKVGAIRAKQAAKPKHSPLPMQEPQTQDALRLAFVLSEIRRDGMDELSAALHDEDCFPLNHEKSVAAIDAAIATQAAQQGGDKQ